MTNEQATSASEWCEPRQWQIWLTEAAFLLLFAAVWPVYYFNRLDFIRRKKRNPLVSSVLVQLESRFPWLYEFAMLLQNFPAWHHVYVVLPEITGDVLQVGCGTGLLNWHWRNRSDITLTNLDTSLRALQWGVSHGRFSTYVHASIDRKIPLPDRTYDAIVFARSFHHVRNHRAALAECARLLRENGRVIIADPVMLRTPPGGLASIAYMGNSSIDGVIWRFTADTLIHHVRECLSSELVVESTYCQRRLHVTNYNCFVPQTDMVMILRRRNKRNAGPNH